ncbi:MAG TPA: PD-(D/E)XK nuclease family protein, partial [Beijerinckiaceae bacterium]|nr:PD-(D/E)XK nuclease family protein [Beijerinckiaceae bacterium]
EAAASWLADRAPRLSTQARAGLLEPVLALLNEPLGQRLFGPAAEAEVAVAGAIPHPDGRRLRVAGRIDRLLVEPDRVTVVDFKTGRPPPAGAAMPGHIVQLALYAALLAQLYPDRRIEAALVWIQQGRIDRIDAKCLDDAITLL